MRLRSAGTPRRDDNADSTTISTRVRVACTEGKKATAVGARDRSVGVRCDGSARRRNVKGGRGSCFLLTDIDIDIATNHHYGVGIKVK